jgi:cytochrome b pre-mRNA-processing protein 3
MILNRLFKRSTKAERKCYEAIVAAARHPLFYADWNVPDTLDGRFDMISLHAFLVLDRLKGEEQAFRQALVDELFADMDRSLREMGVGDISVGKKVRKMAEVFYGRVAAYNQALAGEDGALAAAIARNIFPDHPDSRGPGLLATHVMDQRRHLAAQEARAMILGTVHFKEPTP